jgi:hypothetical protein
MDFVEPTVARGYGRHSAPVLDADSDHDRSREDDCRPHRGSLAEPLSASAM